MTQKEPMQPLCVDLDGTLIHSDLLLETVLLLLKANPLYALQIPFWLLRGKAAFKAEIVTRVRLNPTRLPYNKDFLNWLYEEKESGRKLWLCTASNYRLAQQVADHLQIFQGVVASSDNSNLSGSAKAKRLVEKFGVKGFDYCGNCRVDLAIWQVSHGVIMVNSNDRLLKKAEYISEIRKTFPRKIGLIRPVLGALRLHHWIKNLLVFVPLAAAHQVSNTVLLLHAVTACLAFGLCASSVYLLNDMLDVADDRRHPLKRDRAFAAGELSLIFGLTLALMLLMAAALLALSLPDIFLLTLSGYYIVALAYSFGLKGVVLIDTIILAGLYTIRIVAGAVAIDVHLSFWLLLFSVFIFFSLALVKRYTELRTMKRHGEIKALGRGYHVNDLSLLQTFGTASGYLGVLVLALYINSPAVEPLYRRPQVIWLLCVLVLYWISRVWIKAHRGEMHDDPIVFAFKDRTSWIIGILAVITLIVAV
jgi:4-hydroxybenzoate polyprenyltransferase/phosphoserine phosphatase